MMIGDKKNNRDKVSNAYDVENFEKEQCKNASDKANVSDENKSQAKSSADTDKTYEVEPLPESFRPRKDGPGGN